jgi:hypothetical protein
MQISIKLVASSGGNKNNSKEILYKRLFSEIWGTSIIFHRKNSKSE